MIFPFLLFCVFISLMECMHASNSMQVLNGFRVYLVGIDSLLPANTTSTERWTSAVQRSKERLEKLKFKRSAANLQNDYQTPLSINSGLADYVIQISIGTPPGISFLALMDLASDLVWSKYKPCPSIDCSSGPIYDSSSSTTYSTLNCQSPLCQPLQTFSCDDNGNC